MIWQNCDGAQQVQPISGTLYRLVESQEQVATLGYVDSLDEQVLLEQMLEHVKPAYPADVAADQIQIQTQNCYDDYHYLLKTPFRYPPLKWGSRFGRTHEPSLFYGGKQILTTLAESAYYRFVFLRSIDAPSINKNIRTEHCVFSVDYQTKQGVQLQTPVFVAHQNNLTDPANYQLTQQLGADMRGEGIEAFEYISARAGYDEQTGKPGICVALFTPSAFVQQKPKETDAWLCELSTNEVVFKQLSSRTLTRFNLNDFMVNQVFPMPA